MYSDEYLNYLESDQWKATAEKRKKIDKYRCCMCGDFRNLQVHHIHYRSLAHENVLLDLITLCIPCHKRVHRMMNRTTGYTPTGEEIHGWKDQLSYSRHVLEGKEEQTQN